MRIKVDRAICAGHALCAIKAPDVYQLDEEGYCASDGAEIADDKTDEAKLGAAACPERAIELMDD